MRNVSADANELLIHRTLARVDMKTSELIDLLSATNPPVDQHWLARTTALYALVSLILATLFVLATVGPRIDIASAWRTPPLLLKVGFGACVALIALNLFLASLRPGSAPARRLPLIALPVAAVAALAIAALSQVPTDQWPGLIFGQHWLGCLILVPLYALLPLALLTRLASRGAPVQPRLTGALAGLSSGGLAIVAYCLHCPDDSAPFLSTWYPLALVIAGTTGALVVPRLAKW